MTYRDDYLAPYLVSADLEDALAFVVAPRVLLWKDINFLGTNFSASLEVCRLGGKEYTNI